MIVQQVENLMNGKGGLLFKTNDHRDLSKNYLLHKNKKKCGELLKFAIKNLDRFNYEKNLDKY